MPHLIKNTTVVDDEWQLIDRDHEGELPAGKLLLHLDRWQSLKTADVGNVDIAPWIDSDDDVEQCAAILAKEPLVAIRFPVFADGRGFSNARLLRERYGFQGELRAVGNVIQDQLFFLKRCGFDAFALREGTDLEKALHSLKDFSVCYQTATDTDTPLFRKRSA